MLWRDRFEREYDYLFRELKLGSTTWSPLAGGVLTGRYNSGENIKGARYDTDNPIIKKFWNDYFGDKVKD